MHGKQMVAAIVERYAEFGDGGYELSDELLRVANDLDLETRAEFEQSLLDRVISKRGNYGAALWALGHFAGPHTAEAISGKLDEELRKVPTDRYWVFGLFESLIDLKYRGIVERAAAFVDQEAVVGRFDALCVLGDLVRVSTDEFIRLSVKWTGRLLTTSGTQPVEQLLRPITFALSAANPIVATKIISGVAQQSSEAADAFRTILLLNLKDIARTMPRRRDAAQQVIDVLGDIDNIDH